MVGIDPNTGMVKRRIRVGDDPADIAVGDESVWAVSEGGATASRIDP